MKALMLAGALAMCSLIAWAGAEETSAKPQGKPVTLRVGPGFDPLQAAGLGTLLNQKGCPTTLETLDKGPAMLWVEVGGKRRPYTSVGSAAGSALKWCLEKDDR